MTIKVIDEIDISPILDNYYQLEKNIVWSEFPNGKQAGLQYTEGNDPWNDAVGRVKPEHCWKDAKLNSYFNNSIFETVISKYKITRTRLMWLKPFSCYSMHRDDSVRLHIPLITNDKCFFVFKEDGLHNMEIGKVYWVDTLKEHSAMNCSSEWRLHLLGAF
jgi:hypothetical protein